MYGKILVPLDGSPTSERGFEEAVALARTLKSTLWLVHVIDTTPVAMDMVPATSWLETAEALRQHGQGLLDRALRTATEHGVPGDTRLLESHGLRIADALVDEARAAGCDLVVMGTHGRRGVSHALLGSDAERVVRQCPMPVLLVRHPAGPKA